VLVFVRVPSKSDRGDERNNVVLADEAHVNYARASGESFLII